MHCYIMEIGAQWSCRGRGGGESGPQMKNPLGDRLKFKNQYHFQYDTTKSLSISEVIHNNKLLILIQSFYFTHILHSSESLVYNLVELYIVYDYNHENIV